jgi:pimeloyl-ACP methyl ester carboxylesterase
MTSWILLRGLTRDTRHWGGFPDHLYREANPGLSNVTLIDLPGAGRHIQTPTPHTVFGMMQFVRSTVAEMGVPAPYWLLAMSLGGMVATAWAQRHPEEVDRLVLINTSLRPFCGATKRLRPEAWPALLRVAAAWGDPHGSERLIHHLTCNSQASIAEDLAAWAAIRETAPVSAMNALRQLWAAMRFQAHPEAPRCPTLLLSSAADRLVSPACSAQIAAVWHVPLVQHPWAGHDLPHDDPRWTSTTIRNWLGAG